MTQLWLRGRTLRRTGHGSPWQLIRGGRGGSDLTPSQSDVVPPHSKGKENARLRGAETGVG
jgi:hypothetical protein